MQLLVLGGTRFVGRAVVDDALARGWEVTAMHRGLTSVLPAGVDMRRADRTSEAELTAALGEDSWDAVVDGDPAGTDGGYATCKRGAEMAVLASFPDALMARAGLILGPREDIGRLPWWLGRIARGGPVVAPGRPDRPLQYVDARDLAGWLLSGLDDGLAGPVDLASRSGHARTRELLEACVTSTGSNARLVWIGERALAAAKVEPWTHLPCWVPESGEFAGFLESDTSLAAATGLSCRPVADIVADTWAWLQAEGMPTQRSDRDVHGLAPAVEKRLLADVGVV